MRALHFSWRSVAAFAAALCVAAALVVLVDSPVVQAQTPVFRCEHVVIGDDAVLLLSGDRAYSENLRNGTRFAETITGRDVWIGVDQADDDFTVRLRGNGYPVEADVRYDTIPCVRSADRFACLNTAGLLSWPDHDKSKYWVYRSDDGGDFAWIGRTLGATSFTDVDAPGGATYQVHYAGIPRSECSVPALQTSSLWGASGESYTPRGRLPDYSYAGYHNGEKPLPDIPAVVAVTDFGAVADDGIDDDAAFYAAVAAVPTSGGAVFIPAGTWRLDRPLVIERSNIVLRGAGDGEGGTTIYADSSAIERAEADGLPIDNGAINGKRGHIYGSTDHMIMFEGGAPLTGLADIVADAARGDNTIEVEDVPADYEPGGSLAIRLSDDAEYGSLFRHLHNDQLEGWAEDDPDRVCGTNGSWVFTIKDIVGNRITLHEPLPFDIRSEWQPRIEDIGVISEVGIEDLAVRFRFEPPKPHLQEEGFNGIGFRYVRDGWMRNVTVENADNGFGFLQRTSRSTMTDVTVLGRRGHHGISVSGGASFNLVQDPVITVDDADREWKHTMTVDGRAQGNVVSGISGNKVISLDLHRSTPFENLITEVLSAANFKSGGNSCNGPHTGARLTLWNAAEPIGQIEEDLLKGIDSQVTIVTQTDRADRLDADGLWIENLDDVTPANLYEAQLTNRLNND